MGRGGCEQAGINHHSECIPEALHMVSLITKKRASDCPKGAPEGRKKAAPVGLLGGEDQVEETLRQRKSPTNAYWLLLFSSNTQLCFIFPGPIFWTSEPNER